MIEASRLIPFAGSCLGVGCHISGDEEPDLTPENAFISLQGTNRDGELYINRVVPEESPIYKEVRNGSMPPAGSLSHIEIEYILAWIEKGAVND